MFSSHNGVFDPEQLRLLQRALDRICDGADPEPDEFTRSDIAAKLIACFQAGHTDEESLVSRTTAEAA